MKKLFTTLFLTLLALTVSTSIQCNHEHTDECGEDGVNCTHVCEECVEPYNKEWPDV